MDQSAWEQHLIDTVARNPELQTWSGHLDLRLPELRAILKAARIEGAASLLEVGCGNGLASAYLANSVGRLVATDLPSIDNATHSIGLRKAEKLFELLGLTNAEVVGCSAEHTPFEAESFDVVFSIYSMEHFPNRLACVREAHRVLKPGGKMVAAVPAAALSFFYPLSFYSDLSRRMLGRLAQKLTPVKSGSGGLGRKSGDGGQPVVKDWKSFRKAYPRFPLPQPHGEYTTYFEELWFQRPSSWVELCRAGGFSKVTATPISVLPRGILDAFLGQTGNRLYRHLRKADDALCALPNVTSVAQEICLVCEKGGPGA